MSWISKSLIVVLLFAPARVAAQEGPTDRGSVVLGGSISWSSLGGELYEDSDEERYTSILLNPVALFFVVKSRVVCKSERKLLDASVRLPWRPPSVREA